MPFSRHVTNRPSSHRHTPSARTITVAIVGATLAIGALGVSAPAVAQVLATTTTASAKSMLPSGHLVELRSALATAEAAVADAGVANAEFDAASVTVSTLTINSQELRAAMADAFDLSGDPARALMAKTADIAEKTRAVTDATAALRAAVAAEQARIVAEQEAAAQAAAEVAAAEAAAAANSPDGARETAARIALNTYGWGSDQFSCLESLWNKESGWNYQAENPESGAYGIPQSLPGSKMSSIADDWATNAETQIVWGLQYIDAVYGSPCGAWSHSQATNWY